MKTGWLFALALSLSINIPVSVTPAAEPLPEKMKAVIAHEYGGAEVLKLEEMPVPEPKENEVLVRVIASGVNPADPLILSGKYAQAFGTRVPLVLGYDAAGVVVKTGAKVSRLKVGDAVYAYLLMGGGWAEYCITNEAEAALKPASLTFTEAAAVPLAALTAWQALIGKAKLSAGQTVLIHGGSGGVGSFAIQIAKARGARVIASASTRNQDLLKELGADVAIDYTATPFEDVTKNVDVVLDPVGGDTLGRSYAVVKRGGIVVTLVARCDPSGARETWHPRRITLISSRCSGTRRDHEVVRREEASRSRDGDLAAQRCTEGDAPGGDPSHARQDRPEDRRRTGGRCRASRARASRPLRRHGSASYRAPADPPPSARAGSATTPFRQGSARRSRRVPSSFRRSRATPPASHP